MTPKPACARHDLPLAQDWERGPGGEGLDRFQQLAADLAEKAGAWQHFAFWFAAIAVWLAAGPLLHWSDTWQLLVNTPTTVYELFLGLAILVDGARQIVMLQRMLRHLSDQQDTLERLEIHAVTLIEAIAARDGVSQGNP